MDIIKASAVSGDIGMSIETKLKKWNKKTISKSEMENLLHTGSEAELCHLVSDAAAHGLLSPVKASGTNGNRTYPVYLKYRITAGTDYPEVLSEIALLHPDIIRTGYLKSRPDQYIKYKEQIKALNKYLFQKGNAVPISKKERSFAIFGEEKQLEDSSFCNLLKHLDLTPEVLCYYETPEYCYNDYIPVSKPQMTLLICENKDIWFNIRRRMYEDGADCIFGTDIDGVVYGSGNRISEAGALSEYTHFMGTDQVQYIYWGDIDRAGLNIYLSLIKNNPELCIQLFVPAYTEMLRLAENRMIPDSEDHRERIGDYETIYKLFPENIGTQLEGFLKAGKRIPQEIINYEMLKKVMR